jgi:hypothetical protein
MHIPKRNIVPLRSTNAAKPDPGKRAMQALKTGSGLLGRVFQYISSILGMWHRRFPNSTFSWASSILIPRVEIQMEERQSSFLKKQDPPARCGGASCNPSTWEVEAEGF